MNYISEINEFYNWIMLNPIPADAQALWHVLMQINNRNAVKIGANYYWRVQFTVSNSTLLSILAFSRQQLNRMRNVLIQQRRIVYAKGKGNQSGTYTIIPFDKNVVDKVVDNLVDKVWITTVSHNVAQTVTQTVTQTDTQMLHKADTNGDLCNIMCTLDKHNSNNIIYNNIYSGDGDDMRARACANDSLSDFLPELNEYFGMTEAIKTQIKHITEELFDKYCTRSPSKQDMLKVFENVYHSESTGFRQANMSIDQNRKEKLEYAFRQASLSGNTSWAYIDGILNNLRQRGLRTLDDCEEYDVDREIEKYGL